MTRPFRVGRALIVAAALACSGCVSAVMAPHIVGAPNQTGRGLRWAETQPEARVALARLYAQTFRVPVAGPPATEIAVAVLEPGDYHQRHAFEVRTGPGGKPAFYLDSHWEPLPDEATREPPRGTLVLLHGFGMSREVVLHWGIRLAQAGYRTVLVDLRGHGASGGAWVTYGALETADLAAVLDTLQRRELAGPRIGVFGVSYGGSIGLLWAACDPRVATAVALEPYAEPQLAIRLYARAVLPRALGRSLSDGSLRAATRRAARLASFTWSGLDVHEAITGLDRPVFLIHGAADGIIPVDHSRRLHAAAAAGSRYLEVPGEDHLTLPFRLEGVGDAVAEWFHEHLDAPPAP